MSDQPKEQGTHTFVGKATTEPPAKEVWEKIRLRLFGPNGLFSVDAEDKAAFEECAGYIDAATAQRDAEIERLREELEAKKRIIARSDSEIDRLMDRMERIAQLEALLETVDHEYLDDYPPCKSQLPKCWSDCTRCAWEALKKAK